MINHIGAHLRRIFSGRLSGQLIFRRETVQKHLFFQNGELIHAKTNVPEERLGEILYKLGKISDDAHEELDRYIEPGQKIGKTLSQKGLTSERNVEDGIAYQMREIALSLFPFFDGEIVFQEKPVTAEEKTAKINLPYLIEDGIRRMKFAPALEKMLEKSVPFPASGEFISVLTAEEKEMLGNIKGKVSSEALWRSLKYNPEFYWKTLYLMYCLGIIDFRGPDAVAAAQRAEPKEPSAPAPTQLPEELEEVITLQEKLPSLSYYQILNVPKNATEEEIKKAYFQLARRFHPDRFDRSIPPQYRVQIEDLFDKITKAYRTLISQKDRQAYEGKAPGGGEDRVKDQLVKAETKFRQARTLLNQGRHEDALILLEEVIRLNRTQGRYFLLLAMTESKIPQFNRKAEEHFLKAIELEPWNPEGFVGLGIIYKKEGLVAKAAKQFSKALELDGEHETALRELASLSKDQKKTGLKGLFSSNIFGSKKK
jgi:tetratricopeptide (TPR) repeat protein